MTSGLSVVIAAHNASSTIGEQLDALTNQHWPHGGEIVVADNRSTDRTAAVVAGYSSGDIPIHRVPVDDAPGAGHARNVGVERAVHSSIAFCDADDIVGDRWVAAMTSSLQAAEVVVGPLDYGRLNPVDLRSSRGVHGDRPAPTLFDDTFVVASSCNLGIRSPSFTALGGFDSTYLRAEDSEFSLRMWRAGLTPLFDPDALVHYRMRRNAREIFAQARGWGRDHTRIRAELGTRTSARRRAMSLVWLAARSPMLRNRAGRARWAHVAGTQIGELECMIPGRS